MGAVFAGRSGGRLSDMEDTQREPRGADSSAPAQADETRGQEASAVPTARLLANPRRIRRT